MTRDDLDTLTLLYLQQSFDDIEANLALDWAPEGRSEYASQLNKRCHALSGALSFGDLSTVINDAARMAPDADRTSHRKLARRLLEAQLVAAKAELRAFEGEPLRRPEMASPRSAPKSKPTPVVSELARLYSEERLSLKRWSPKTAEQARKIFLLISSLLDDRPIGEVSKTNIRELGLDLAKLPPNLTKKYPGLSPREVLARTTSDLGVERMAARSVNKHYQHVRTLFAWAAEHDYIANSPAVVLHDVLEERAQEARKCFEDEDISALFDAIAQLDTEPFGIWIPRIMAYTGCRMGEAAQLRKIDIRKEQDVWVFDFNEDSEEKNLKTTGSKRWVPVHPRLIELGILAFAVQCSEEYLFPERFRFTENEIRGNVDRLSKILNRWLRSAGITDKKKTFQSFRATMSTRLKDLNVPEYQIAEILGHENSNITTGRYGKRTNLNALQEALSRLVLPI